MNTIVSLNRVILLSSCLMLGLVGCQKSETTAPAQTEKPAMTTPAAPSTTLDTLEKKVSYGIGRNVGTDLARNVGFDADVDALVAGLKDAMAKRDSQISEADLQAAFQEIRQKGQAAAAAKAATVKADSAAFLAQNAKRPGVVTTASGLQYEILKAGTGPKPKPSNTVKVHYHGTLIDGTVFDSSVQRGEPIEFPVTGVIKGWIEALQLMPQGSKWKLFIPSDLAYGDRGQGNIPPGAALIFEVELLEIK